MQYIAGEDLGGMLRREKRPAPVETVLTWADQLLDVLSYLHANDPPIVHRDIKPDNMKLTQRGTIVLLDFGLAKGSTRVRILGGLALVVVVALGGFALWQFKPWKETAPPTAAKNSPSTAVGLNANSGATAPSGGFVATPPPQPAPSPSSKAVPDSPKSDAPSEPEAPSVPPEDKPDRESPDVVRVSEAVLRRNAVRLVPQDYPKMARAAGVEGDVVVEIVVNESGDVARARAVSGHPLLRDSAVRAARASKFKPTVRSGEPVKVVGTLTYYFRTGISSRDDDLKKQRG